MELSQTREEIYHSTVSTFTSVGFQDEYCPRVLFEQDSQPQNSSQEPCRFLSERKGDHSTQKGQSQILRQECPSQRIRN